MSLLLSDGEKELVRQLTQAIRELGNNGGTRSGVMFTTPRQPGAIEQLAEETARAGSKIYAGLMAIAAALEKRT